MTTRALNSLQSRKHDIDLIANNLNRLCVDESIITKASIILMAYNMIEGVFFILLQDFFDHVQTDFSVLDSSEKLKDLILRYHLKIINNDYDRFKIFHNKKNMEIPDFPKFKDTVVLFSGNLDAKKIRDISKRFDVTYPGHSGDESLLYIKNIRNKLAHGELGYAVACRDKTDAEIVKCVNNAFNYMNRVVNAFVQKYS